MFVLGGYENGILSCSCLICDFSCSTVCGLLSYFTLHHAPRGRGRVWTADRPVLYSKVMWLHIVLLEEAGISVKMTLSGWQHELLQSLHLPFSIKGDVMVAHAMGQMPLHTITEAGFALALVSGQSISSLVWKTRRPWFPKTIQSVNSSDQRKLLQFFVPGSEKSEAILDAVDMWLALHKVVPCFCRCSN